MSEYYQCGTCSTLFYEDELRQASDDGEFYYLVSPCCRDEDYEKVLECDFCGVECLAYELDDDLCRDCEAHFANDEEESRIWEMNHE